MNQKQKNQFLISSLKLEEKLSDDHDAGYVFIYQPL